MRDIARVELGAQTYSRVFRQDNKPAKWGLYLTPGANALTVAKEVQTGMKALAAFPPGVTYEVPFDTTLFVTNRSTRSTRLCSKPRSWSSRILSSSGLVPC